MTQKEIETKVTELRDIYADRRRDLIAHFETKIQEVETSIAEEDVNYNEIHIALLRKYDDLLTKNNELQRQGLPYYSEERDAVQKEMRETKIQLKEERAKHEAFIFELIAKMKGLKNELQENLFNNARMRAKAKKELWAKLEKVEN